MAVLSFTCGMGGIIRSGMGERKESCMKRSEWHGAVYSSSFCFCCCMGGVTRTEMGGRRGAGGNRSEWHVECLIIIRLSFPITA